MIYYSDALIVHAPPFGAGAPAMFPALVRGFGERVSNNAAALLGLSAGVNMCRVCQRGDIAMRGEARSLEEKREKNAASPFPQRDGVSRLRHESFWTVSVARLKL